MNDLLVIKSPFFAIHKMHSILLLKMLSFSFGIVGDFLLSDKMHKGMASKHSISFEYIFFNLRWFFFYFSLPNEHSPSEMHVHMNYENEIPFGAYRFMPQAFILNGLQ